MPRINQIWHLNLENTISQGVLWENSEQFMQWTENNLCKKIVNNFLNNAKQKIILYRMLEIVLQKTVNNFYEKTVIKFN